METTGLWWTDPRWWQVVVTSIAAIGTLCAVIVAIYGDWIRGNVVMRMGSDNN